MTVAICRKCGTPSENLQETMLNGCPECGNRLFSIQRGDDQIAEVEPDKDRMGHVAIKVKDRGKYIINLPALASRKGENNPIFVEGEDGVIRVVLDTGDE